MEVEAKFGIPDEETFQRLLKLDSLAGLRLQPLPLVDIHDRYFDTADGDLRAAGLACRVRREGDHFVGTIKGMGSAEGAIHRRIEHETTLARPLSPDHWPPGELRALVERMSRGKPLRPLFDIEQARHRRVAWDKDGAVAEISLDRVRVDCDGAEVDHYLEAEAELMREEGAQELARLADQLAEQWGLEPQPRSKFERAMELFPSPATERGGCLTDGMVNGGTGLNGAAPAAQEIVWDDPMCEAGRKTLRRQFQKMVNNEPGTRLGEDPEALHDMRVATRRMRAAFRVFGDYYIRGEIAGYEKVLKRTGRALGPVRDLDVFIEKVRAYLDMVAPASVNLDSLLAALTQKRDAARGSMITYLDDEQYVRFKDEFARFCETEGMAGRPVTQDAAELEPYRVREVAPAAIYRRLAVVRAYDERVRAGSASLEQLHALRIACKRLRYTFEFFQEVLGPDAKTVIRDIVHMQDHLGAIQDVVVARELLHALLSERPHDPGIAQYVNYREEELSQLLETLPQAWSRLSSAEFDQMVAQAIVSK